MKKTKDTKATPATKEAKPAKENKEIKKEAPTDAPLVDAKFKIKQINWKIGSTAWNLVLEILDTMNESFINYSAEMYFDEEPHLEKIKNLEDDIAEIRNENKLFKKQQKEDVKEIEDEIKFEREEHEEIKKECKLIMFTATALKIDMTGSWPSVTLAVASDVIVELNRVKTKVGHYKLILRPIKI